MFPPFVIWYEFVDIIAEKYLKRKSARYASLNYLNEVSTLQDLCVLTLLKRHRHDLNIADLLKKFALNVPIMYRNLTPLFEKEGYYALFLFNLNYDIDAHLFNSRIKTIPRLSKAYNIPCSIGRSRVVVRESYNSFFKQSAQYRMTFYSNILPSYEMILNVFRSFCKKSQIWERLQSSNKKSNVWAFVEPDYALRISLGDFTFSHASITSETKLNPVYLPSKHVFAQCDDVWSCIGYNTNLILQDLKKKSKALLTHRIKHASFRDFISTYPPDPCVNIHGFGLALPFSCNTPCHCLKSYIYSSLY